MSWRFQMLYKTIIETIQKPTEHQHHPNIDLTKLTLDDALLLWKKVEKKVSETLYTELQVYILLQYLDHFAQVFGFEHFIPFWLEYMLQFVGARLKDLNELFVHVLNGFVTADPDGTLPLVLSVYFENKSFFVVEAVILYAMGNPDQAKDIFGKLGVSIRDNENDEQISGGLELLCELAQREGIDIHKITQTNTLEYLFDLLESSSNFMHISTAIMLICLLFTYILDEIPSFIDRLFYIFNRILCWSLEDVDQLVPELRVSIKNLFQHLYAMFPCNFLSYIKKECKSNSVFASRINPLLENSPFNTYLISNTKESELSLERWNKKDPIQIISNFYGADYRVKLADTYENIHINEETSDRALTKILEAHNNYFSNKLEMDENIENVQFQLLELKNLAIFERHLRKLYVKRLFDVNKTLQDNEKLQSEKKELKLEKKVREEKNIILEQENERLRTTISTLQSKISKKSNTRYKIEILNKQNEDLKDNIKSKEDIILRQEEEIQSLNSIAGPRENLIMKLEKKVDTLSDKLVSQEKWQKIIVSLNEEIGLWEEQHKQSEETFHMQQNLQNLLKLRDKTIFEQNEKLQILTDNIRSLKRKFNELKDYIITQERKKIKLSQQIQDLKRLLENQQSISVIKIEAVERKYNSIKNINIELNVCHTVLNIYSSSDRYYK
eukprot:TRINITY_DN4989_c0_g1_i3.p1 TRINITY_DN4989_c0_g1~~TRINITY_DN4989_c0_g1_i3.p1  ORF type:complete len:681 (+),score=117.28 TRINITY_DN4989_c0_g1_i3:31-2043(+)